MRIRYFKEQNKKDFCGSLIAETNGWEIIPRRKEKIIINDVVYKVHDVVYYTDFTGNSKNEINIGMVDIMVI